MRDDRYDENSLDSKITALTVAINCLTHRMEATLDEDKRMHNVINKWLLGLTLLVVIDIFGGDQAAMDFLSRVAIAATGS